jgi:hypothetical protein
MKTALKAGRAIPLSIALFVLLAGPASAATPVVAAAKPWHYWMAPVLTLSFVGLLVMMLVGYVVKVVMLKYGVKVGRKST